MSTLTMRPETWPAILISAARRSPIRARHGRHPDQAPNRIRRLRARLHHGQQSHQVIAPTTTGQLGMAAAGQIQLAVVSAAAGDRDSAYGTVISVAPSHCQSAFVLQRERH
jgi:hypothetical protein